MSSLTDYSPEWIRTAAKRHQDEAFVKDLMRPAGFFAVTASSPAFVRRFN
jgi:hypothetical protein